MPCVLMTANGPYLETAAFAAKLLRQAGVTHPILIYTDDPAAEVGVPGVDLRRIEVPGSIAALPTQSRHGIYAYWRFPAIDDAAREHDRILYMDTDIVPVRPGVAEVLAADLGGHAVGAVWDFTQWLEPWRPAKEWRLSGLPDAPYLNSGLLLVDAALWRDGHVTGQCLDAARRWPDAVVRSDQSLLNLALQGAWAELPAVNNYQWSRRSAKTAMRRSPAMIHFIGPRKPWSEDTGFLPPPVHAAWKAHRRGEKLEAEFAKLSDLSRPLTLEERLKGALYAPRLRRLLAR